MATDLTKQLADALRRCEQVIRDAGDENPGQWDWAAIDADEGSQARAALAAYSAQQSAPSEQPGQGEREAFEAWAEDKWPWAWFRDAAFQGWQARAALASQPAARVALTTEQKDNLIAAYFPTQRKEVLALISAVEKFYGITAPAAQGEQG